jgi:predicted SAM-dependent methyltransferase
MKDFLLRLFSHRTLAGIRWDLHMLRVRIGNCVKGSPKKLRAFVAKRQEPVLLNLGSGPRGLATPNWINVDAFPDTNVHFLLDFNRQLPFTNESLDGVFCEHVLEHFSIEDGLKLLKEIHRSLKPGGCVRIIVPDAPWVMRTYFDNPTELVRHRTGGTDPADLNATPMEIVNLYFRQRYEHHFLYDFSTMHKMLTEAGFATVHHTAFKKSTLREDLALDDPKYEAESLYVEARK